MSDDIEALKLDTWLEALEAGEDDASKITKLLSLTPSWKDVIAAARRKKKGLPHRILESERKIHEQLERWRCKAFNKTVSRKRLAAAVRASSPTWSPRGPSQLELNNRLIATPFYAKEEAALQQKYKELAEEKIRISELENELFEAEQNRFRKLNTGAPRGGGKQSIYYNTHCDKRRHANRTGTRIGTRTRTRTRTRKKNNKR